MADLAASSSCSLKKDRLLGVSLSCFRSGPGTALAPPEVSGGLLMDRGRYPRSIRKAGSSTTPSVSAVNSQNMRLRADRRARMFPLAQLRQANARPGALAVRPGDFFSAADRPPEFFFSDLHHDCAAQGSRSHSGSPPSP